MKVALIANPLGNKNVASTIDQAVCQLKAHDIHCDQFVTEYHGHAFKIVQALPIQEYDALIAMGGDGTNYYVLNGILKFQANRSIPTLGVIPVGRGNSFAKDLEINSIEDGIAAIIRKRTVPVDVCSYTQADDTFYFINLMGFGFVTDVARTAARFSRYGDLSYVIGVFHRTIGLQFHRMELEIDGTVFDSRNCFVEFCNSRYTGGDMLMAPEAQINDGCFDAVILAPLSRLNLLTTFPKIFKGTHVDHPAVQVVRGKYAVVHTDPPKALLPDGEIYGSTPTTIKVLPRLVRYFA
jgi:YegS/Rv2252/BmrU family lipid kinase